MSADADRLIASGEQDAAALREVPLYWKSGTGSFFPAVRTGNIADNIDALAAALAAATAELRSIQAVAVMGQSRHSDQLAMLAEIEQRARAALGEGAKG
jgi:capsule polysaccharide modification protein KpsS